MTNPGFNAHQAAQQAAQRASQQAQQAAARATQQAVQHASDAARMARESAQRSARGGFTPSRLGTYHDSARRTTPPASGPVRRLVGLLFSLVVVAVVIGILLVVLGAVAPDWFDQVTGFFGEIF